MLRSIAATSVVRRSHYAVPGGLCLAQPARAFWHKSTEESAAHNSGNFRFGEGLSRGNNGYAAAAHNESHMWGNDVGDAFFGGYSQHSLWDFPSSMEAEAHLPTAQQLDGSLPTADEAAARVQEAYDHEMDRLMGTENKTS